jgi:hypothetical protein
VLKGQTTTNQGAVSVPSSKWMIGSHNLPDKPRYFVGCIYGASVDSKSRRYNILQTDSDNNGYITDPLKNLSRAVAECNMGANIPKPITYFPAINPDIVPPDYKVVELKVLAASAPAGTNFQFNCTSNLQVVTLDVNNDYVPITLNQNIDTTKRYFARAQNAVGTSVDSVTLSMFDANGTNLGSDSVWFDVKQTLNGWVVPSAWKIEANNTVTTPTTPIDTSTTANYTTAVGPQTEGSGPVGSAYDSKGPVQSITNPKGDAFMVDTYPNGFRLNLTYAFVRNTTSSYTDATDKTITFPTGYIQPDRKKSEKTEDQNQHNLDFIGNSGIKFGGLEFQIFDTMKFVEGFNITQGTVNHDVNSPSIQVAPTTQDAGWICDDVKPNADPAKRRYYLTHNYIRYNGVKADNVISGILYSKGMIVAPTKRWNDVNAAQTLQQANNTLEINIYPSGIGDKWYVLVTINNTTVFENNEVVLPDADRYIFIQSHWGSGVIFQIDYVGPPQLH